MSDSTVVLKFGSSVLADESALPAVILEIYREIRRGRRVMGVVSAFGSTTDELIKHTKERFERPDPACLARLLETGEAVAAATLGLALDQAGVPARIFDPGQLKMRTRGGFLDAEPYTINPDIVQEALREVPVVIVPGFSGRREDGAPALLGRGGSDLTALFLAREIDAEECRLLKDVDGLLKVHPDGTLDFGTRYAAAHYDDCLQVGGPLIQPKAVEFAARNRMHFTICRCGSSGGTLAGPVTTRFEKVEPVAHRTRVGLAGLGTVGLGVFRWLAGLPEEIEVVGILVKDGFRQRAPDVPADLVTDSVNEFFESGPELVVEVVGGCGTAAKVVASARSRDVPVISANKMLLALDPTLREAAAGPDNSVSGAASVGGSVPVLESVAALAAHEPVVAVEGVINGTCNFILDLLNRGQSEEEALGQARDRGLVEMDPHLDISGLDAVFKLSLISTAAFGQGLSPDQIRSEGLDQATDFRLTSAREKGGELKLVARARRKGGAVEARVELHPLLPGHPLFGCSGERNRVVVETASGRQVVLDGRGAGRWPTTVSVVSDVLDRHRDILAGSGKGRAPSWKERARGA
jgi:homoserine dehydrogenase